MPDTTPRADVLAEEYKGQYLWAEIDTLKASNADMQQVIQNQEAEIDRLRKIEEAAQDRARERAA